jgi:hypothetical protein
MEGERIAELEAQLSEVQSALSDAEQHAADLVQAVEPSKAAVDDFRCLPWRLVVGPAARAAGKVERAADAVKSAVGEACNAAKPSQADTELPSRSAQASFGYRTRWSCPYR